MAQTLILTEEEALDLAAFLVTAARALLDEPVDYGPMRLLSAAERLCSAAAPRSSSGARELFTQLSTGIPSGLPERLRDPDGYRAFLDGLCATVAHGLARRAWQEA